jgi:hypothetical protein
MKKLALIWLFLAGGVSAFATEIDSLIAVLDSSLAISDKYMEMKEMRIRSLKLLSGKTDLSPEQAYSLNTLLYKEYVKYNFDSTLFYLNRNQSIAIFLKKTEWIQETKFHIANLLAASGLYSEALKVLKSISPHELSAAQKTDYYASFHYVYVELSMYTVLKESADEYSAISKSYRDTLLAVLKQGTPEYLLLYEAYLLDKGNLEGGLKVNDELLSQAEKWSPEYAVYTFQRAIAYRMQGDTQNAEKYLILSAISDIRSAVKDNVSLTLLSILLFDRKEIDRAYRYITFSLEDAKFYNSRLRYIEISKILPMISEAFQIKNEKQKSQLRFYALVITFMAFLLILAVVIMYIQMQKRSKTRTDLHNANVQLNAVSHDLFNANAQLKALNHELVKSNHVKEEHIGFFLSLCSTYIDKLEDFRKMVHRKVSTGQHEDLFKLTRSAQFFDSELKDFYVSFDNTFLHLFPGFVDEFNALLSEEERIILKVDESLNTEIRIFALIRLGITDSSKIASFLRYSVNTIYNYRTRVRNKALVPRDDFENRVRRIGISEE